MPTQKRKKRKLTQAEKDARDKRYRDSIARWEALPKTIAEREACRRADSVGRMDWMAAGCACSFQSR